MVRDIKYNLANIRQIRQCLFDPFSQVLLSDMLGSSWWNCN